MDRRGPIAWIGRLFGVRRRRHREVDTEIAAHLEMRMRQLTDQGVPPSAARREAERRFGDLETARRRLYASARQRDHRLRRAHRLESLGDDLRSGIRRLRDAPAAAALSIATFALGIGLTTATFSIVDHALLRPLPFDDPDALVSLHSVAADGEHFPWVSATNWLDWAEQNRTLESTAIYSIFGNATIVMADDAFTVPAKYVSGRFFEVLRTPLAAGRPLTDSDVRDQADVAVVSEGLWRRVLDAAPELPVTISVSGRPTRVVGVVAAGFEVPEGTQMWLPATYRHRPGAARNNINWLAIGRLAAGVEIDAARADLAAIADGIRTTDPAGIYSHGVGVYSLKSEIVGSAERTLLLAMGCVIAVLLVSCANLAGLEFARSAARAHETAVRVALGAGRWRIVQRAVVEQVVLALCGGAAGTALAWWGTAALLARYELPVPRAEAVSIDLRVVGVALLVSVSSGIVAATLPAALAARTRPGRALAGARGAVRGGRGAPGAALVAAEVAVAVVLLVAGGLLARNFSALVGRDLGFQPAGLVTADVALTAPRYRESPELRIEYWRAAIESLSAIPGVEAVAAGNPIPTGTGGRGFVDIEGRPDLEAGADYRVVSRDYFATLQIPLLAGRLFEASDGVETGRVAIISRTTAEAYWPDENPVGQRLRARSQEAMLGTPWLLIIGVTEDVRQYGFADDPATAMYVLHEQVPTHTGGMTLLARTSGNVEGLIGVARDRLRALDGELAVDVTSLDIRLGGRVATERLLTTTLGLFAALGLALAGIGIYGLLSFAVGQRAGEIAVRMAVGARAHDVVAMILRNALTIVVVGLAAGLALAWGGGGLIAAVLVDVQPRDPLTYVAVAMTMLVAAIAAALVPALRAARQAPVDVLRRS